MAEVSDPRLGKLLEGRYRLDQRLGAGGMGVVYRGELVAIGKPVAVKLLHEALAAIPDLSKRLQREAQAMSKLHHPNLVSVIDSGVSEGVPYLVMDFVSGRTLSDLITDGPLPAARAVGIARQVCAGLAHAHGLGVVHRDLKPDNILLMNDVEGDFVKILDFGLAKLAHAEGTQLTNSGFALGTPGYMSPEQARGTEADKRSDIYSVGVLLYQLVTGRKPFIADSPLAVMRMHMDEEPAPPTKVAPRSCSPELEKVILRAMEKEPRHRFQTAADLSKALAATPEASGADPSTAAAPVPPRRSFGVLGLVGRVVVAAIVVGAFVFAWQKLSHRQQVKLKHEVDSAVKVAQGAFQSLRPGQKPPSEKQPAEKPPSEKQPPAKQPPVKQPPAVAPTATAPPPPKPEAKPPAPVADLAQPPRDMAPPPEVADEEDEDDDDTVEPKPPQDTPGARLEEQAPPPPPPTTPHPHAPSIRDAAHLYNAGRYDEAVQTLYAVRRHSPRDPDAALWLGHCYFKKLWRTDGLREYDNAIKLQSSLRHEGLLIRNSVSALEGPTYRLARAVIKARIGIAAKGELRRFARTAKSPRVRARAARLAAQVRPIRR